MDTEKSFDFPCFFFSLAIYLYGMRGLKRKYNDNKDNKEKMLQDKRFYKFLIPSLIGAFLFVTPINRDGSLTIPIAVAANWLLNLMGDYTLTIIWLLISASAILTILHKWIGIGLFKRNEKLNSLFGVKKFWCVVRMIGFVFANMIYFGDGLTDVPTMKMTRQKGGYSIVVHAPGETVLSDDMLLQNRADFAIEADYSAGSELEDTVRDLIRRIVDSAALSRRHAKQLALAMKRRGPVEPDVMHRTGLDETELE